MSERLFTRTELDELCLSGLARVAAALESGDADRAKAAFRDADAAYREFHAIYHAWAATIFEFLFERHGHDAVTKATPLGGALVAATEELRLDAARARAFEECVARFDALLDRGDRARARRFAEEHEATARALHDWYRDWVSSLLSHVYRQHGVEELEQCLRYSSERGWMPWMMEDITHDAATRLRDWTRLLCVGNFATIRIEEDDEKFVIVQDPCGSCGRQDEHADGSPPWNLAMVREKHPITFCRGDVSAYRTHIAVMHHRMPLERIGAPWPPIHCPKVKGEPCTILFYKDPRHADPGAWEEVGLTPPAAG